MEDFGDISRKSISQNNSGFDAAWELNAVDNNDGVDQSQNEKGKFLNK